MTEKRDPLPRREGPLRVAIDSNDPLVAAGLERALDADASVELTAVGDPRAIAIRDLGPTRGETRGRLLGLPRSSSSLVLVADPADAPLALAAGAQGVLLRELDADKLLAALRAIAHGLTVLDVALADRVRGAALRPGDARATLTARELEVLRLLADGLSNKRIARTLDISEHTAKFHVNAILEKLDATTRTEAVVTAVRSGLLWL